MESAVVHHDVMEELTLLAVLDAADVVADEDEGFGAVHLS